MKLAPKFTVIFVAAFGVMLVIAGILCYSYIRRNANDEVFAQAQLMMEAAAAMRTYTNEQIKPLGQQRHATEFHAQWVPAYAATQVFSNLHKKYPAYTYKEAALNPTNLRDLPQTWEADIINAFRNQPDLHEFVGERDTPQGRSLYFAHPISVAPSCLQCHNTSHDAPQAMMKLYNPANGFGWKLNEIVGAQIVSVPAEVASRLTGSAIQALATALICFALVSLIILNVLLRMLVVEPLGRITAAAHQTLREDPQAADIPVRGNDEIAALGHSVNRLRRRTVPDKTQS